MKVATLFLIVLNVDDNPNYIHTRLVISKDLFTFCVCFTVLRTCPFSLNHSRTCIILLILNVGSDFQVLHMISGVVPEGCRWRRPPVAVVVFRMRRLPGFSGFHNKLEIFKATLLSKQPY